ncbi:MAG: FemAB family PEP-CTERM system-associated protein [Chitinivibrionales bacterium]|nr:FemAB family PEP-CTERM system-associated protein [Chitinivibrionales bacterium]
MTTIIQATAAHAAAWDEYVERHPHASVYHYYAFRNAVENCYGHRSLYFAALGDTTPQRLCGVLPLFFIAGGPFGKSVVSLPFCDYGGILADTEKTAGLLFEKAVDLMRAARYDFLELRQTTPLPFLLASAAPDPLLRTSADKVRMLLRLPASADELFASFTAKLRSQIRKPQKDGCTLRSGGSELLNDFYRVFVYNMRDLGSPVHPKKMMANVLRFYGDRARLFVVYKDNFPVACSLVAGRGRALVNPWASFNKRYRASAPNMLLYWGMLEFAVHQGYGVFDFGRSTKDEGTYRFKEQWGAKPEQLTWFYYFRKKGGPLKNNGGKNRDRFIKLWRILPLRVTQIAGPIIRKRISL